MWAAAPSVDTSVISAFADINRSRNVAIDPKTYQPGQVFPTAVLKRNVGDADSSHVNKLRERDGRELLADQVSARNIAARIAGALGGLSLAYLAGRWTMIELTGDGVATVGGLAQELGIFLAFAGVALTVTSTLPIRRDLLEIRQLVHDNETELRERSRAQRFLRRVGHAFDMAERESDLFEISAIAMRDASNGPGEILGADSSNAHIERLAIASDHPAPGCSVTTPRSCPAVRSGQTMKFASPNGLAACPRLRERQLDDGQVAICVPVNVLGTPSAVLHAVRDRSSATDEELASSAAALEGVAVRFGARLGMLRAMSQSQLQADTDPLTGLLNRRAMENQVREMRTEHESFAVVMADLDHFKDLNDTFGHDTGDRALRLFSRVLRSAVRDADIVCRHGGEEFVIVLPGANTVTAAPVLHRLQERLADSLTDAKLPTFTVSLGLVDSSASDDLSDLVNLADRALLQAKVDGRDRIVIWDPSLPAGPADRADRASVTAES
jgi:diguanylate cyclase (GGDEF)-like protein